MMTPIARMVEKRSGRFKTPRRNFVQLTDENLEVNPVFLLRFCFPAVLEESPRPIVGAGLSHMARSTQNAGVRGSCRAYARSKNAARQEPRTPAQRICDTLDRRGSSRLGHLIWPIMANRFCGISQWRRARGGPLTGRLRILKHNSEPSRLGIPVPFRHSRPV